MVDGGEEEDGERGDRGHHGPCGRIRPRLATRSISCLMLAAAAPRGGSCSAVEFPDLGCPPARGMFRLLLPSTIARLLCIREAPPVPIIVRGFQYHDSSEPECEVLLNSMKSRRDISLNKIL